MENHDVVNAQPELFGIIDGTKSYMYEKLWTLCAGPLFDIPKIGENVYYFPQGQIEIVGAYTREDLNQIQPIFNLPSKIQCRVMNIQLKAENDEAYLGITLVPDTNQVIIPPPGNNQQMPMIQYFTKVLTPSDASIHGGFSIPKRDATDCLPLLDSSIPIPSQELVAKDLHGQPWTFRHTFRGSPQRHLLTKGWNSFSTSKKLVAGDCFIFLRGETGEQMVGIRKRDQQGNIPSPLISTQSIVHGVIASVKNAFDNKCVFDVVYKPRSSQFVISYEKFVAAVNNKFNVGSRFVMSFEGDDFSVKRYSGTIVAIKDFSPYWKESEWRSLQVEWDDVASFPRPNRVSPWEIEHLVPSTNNLQSTLLKNKRFRQVDEISSTSSSNRRIPKLIEGQETGQPSSSSLMNVPTVSKLNSNNNQMVYPIENITTNVTTSCKVFGVDLTTPSNTKKLVRPIDSHQISEISKPSQGKNLDQTQTLGSPKEIQSMEFSSKRSCTKVQMQGVSVGRAVDLTNFDGYDRLVHKLDEIFDLKGELRNSNEWKIVFIDNEGDCMLFGDDPWPEFCNIVKKIYICSKEEVKKIKSGKQIVSD